MSRLLKCIPNHELPFFTLNGNNPVPLECCDD